MQVTFRANTRVLGFLPGKIYTVELEPLLEELLKKDVHVSLIDPPTLDPQPAPASPPVASPKVVAEKTNGIN